MNDANTAQNQDSTTTYQVEDRQFIVHRTFNTQKTLPELLIAEITNGLLQNGVLNSAPDYGIIDP